MKPHEETVLVTIQRVTEKRTRPDWKHPNGQRRFEIDAERIGDASSPIWCSTLDQCAADRCLRGREIGQQMLLTIRMVTLHGRFGSTSKVYNLVAVAPVSGQVPA